MDENMNIVVDNRDDLSRVHRWKAMEFDEVITIFSRADFEFKSAVFYQQRSVTPIPLEERELHDPDPEDRDRRMAMLGINDAIESIEEGINDLRRSAEFYQEILVIADKVLVGYKLTRERMLNEMDISDPNPGWPNWWRRLVFPRKPRV
jgi:hypothetical protein